MRDSSKPSDARYNEFRHIFKASNWGPVQGRRLTLKMLPSDAVHLSVKALLAQGFRDYPKDIASTLAGEGSPWTAAAVEIGTARNWGYSFLSDILLETPIGLLMRLRSKVGQVFVMATARELPGGLTELVVMPHPGGGDPDHTNASQPQLNAAIAQIIRQARSVGLLVDEGTPIAYTKFTDTSCPASVGNAPRILDLNLMGEPRRRRGNR